MSRLVSVAIGRWRRGGSDAALARGVASGSSRVQTAARSLINTKTSSTSSAPCLPPLLLAVAAQRSTTMAVLSPLSAPLPAHLHVVFSAECIPAFDWQSVGLFYAFNRTRQPGRITRLLACSDEQLATYPQANMDMGPTFVHRNMRFDAVNDAERGDPFHDDKSGHGCPPPPSNSRLSFQRRSLTCARPAAAAQTPATTSHSLSRRGLSRSMLRRSSCS